MRFVPRAKTSTKPNVDVPPQEDVVGDAALPGEIA